jgi:thiamine biosynthesis lipoprotein
MRPALGTFVEIQLIGHCSDREFVVVAKKAFSAIDKVGELMSFHSAQSDLTRLNQAPLSKWVRIHPWTARVLRQSLSFQKVSQGFFNIAIADVLVSKGLLPGKKSRTSHRYINQAPAFEVRKNQARRLLSVRVDLGGIAKGFAVDRAVDSLRKNFDGSGVINAGGDLRAFGKKASSVHIRSRKNGFSGQVLRIRESAIATSDSGPDKVNSKGKTLRPGKTVSVIASDCMTADALTKIALIAKGALVNSCLERYEARLV